MYNSARVVTFMIVTLGAFPPSADAQIPFRRGDVDGSGVVDHVADAAYLSEALFGSAILACNDAADANDDGGIDITDILIILNAGFTAGAPPVQPPYPDCGLDPTTADGLDCATYDNCAGAARAVVDDDFLVTIDTPSGDVGSIVEVSTTLDVAAGSALRGWSFGVCHPVERAALNGVEPGSALISITPDFQSIETYPEGWTTGILLDLSAALPLGAGTDYELYVAQYELLGIGTAQIELCDTLGDPPVPISFVRADVVESVLPVITGGLVTIGASDAIEFRRGDSNDDSTVNVADAIWLVSYIFQDGPQPTCLSAGDANDDGQVDIGDVIWLINYSFSGGAQPPSPFPACGTDPSSDGLSCNSSSSCL